MSWDGEVVRGSVTGNTQANGFAPNNWTWQHGQSANDVGLNAVTASGTAGAVCAVGDAGNIQTSSDGVTWTYRGPLTGAPFTAVSSVDSTHGWAVGSDSDGYALIAATSDGGATWAAQPKLPADCELYGVDFVDLQHGWAVGDIWTGSSYVAAVCATANGGTTWTQTTLDEFAPLLAVDFFDAKTGWAVGETGTIIRTADGGHDMAGADHDAGGLRCAQRAQLPRRRRRLGRGR